MKKIIIAFDGTQFSEGAFAFARHLNCLQPILLTGIFIPQLTYSQLWSYSVAMAGNMVVPMLEDEDAEVLQKNIERFVSLCQQHNIQYKIHKDFFDFALPELKRETRFADLLILGSETFYSSLINEEPSDFLEDALHTAECPVILVPEKFKLPDINIFTYDGSESSVYALKQFSYLLPEFCNHETHIVFCGETDGARIPQENQLKELILNRFMDFEFTTLKRSENQQFKEWVQQKDNAIIICGSYGRSMLSQLFKTSFIHDVLATHKLPIFIAHK